MLTQYIHVLWLFYLLSNKSYNVILLDTVGLEERLQEELMTMYNRYQTVIKENKTLYKKLSDAGIPIDSANVTDWEQVGVIT